MIWNLPNILTLLRLLAAVLVALLFVVLPRPFADWAALGLFVAAALTDWIDGYLARGWKQETKIGAMMDPIADKAMVVVTLLVLVGTSALAPWLVLPAALILFREVFVSGLREYLADVAGTLKVTPLAKWKTTAQMVAIVILLAHGLCEHYLGMAIWGMDSELVQQILAREVEDLHGIATLLFYMEWAGRIGIWLLWLAALLTVLTGADYLRKAMPHLRETD